MEINLPVLPLRDYQEKLWLEMFDRNIKKAFILMHRRAGKDIFCLQYMIAKAIQEKGNYWYILPQQNQVRRAIWEGITSSGIKYLSLVPSELVEKFSEQEMKIYLRNGSIISFLGGDRYDSLVGAGIKGCVISEYALQKPNLFDTAIEPMLRESKGWVLFNTTPRGENHAKDMFDFLSKKPEYLTCRLTIEDTGVVSVDDINEERERGKPEELIQQEYYVSFAGAIYGAYYADVLSKNDEKNGLFPYDARFPVYTAWDLGVSDSMAITFFQCIEKTIRIIDYYENSTYGLGHYVNVIKGKQYTYGCHYIPHDGVQRQLTYEEKALSIQNQLITLGLNKVEVITRTSDVYADIQGVRSLLPRIYWNKELTKDLYLAVKQYRREYDENRKCFKDSPYHDWTSHGSDTLRVILKAESKINSREKERVGVRWNGAF